MVTTAVRAGEANSMGEATMSSYPRGEPEHASDGYTRGGSAPMVSATSTEVALTYVIAHVRI